MDPSQPYFPITQKEKKKSKKKDSSTAVFCELYPSLRTPFLITSPVAASEDEHDETKLLQMTSRLSICYLCMIRYELFWQPIKMDT